MLAGLTVSNCMHRADPSNRADHSKLVNHPFLAGCGLHTPLFLNVIISQHSKAFSAAFSVCWGNNTCIVFLEGSEGLQTKST